jgi:hypothetical protein
MLNYIRGVRLAQLVYLQNYMLDRAWGSVVVKALRY